MKRPLFSNVNLYLISVIIGIILILLVIYNLVEDYNAGEHQTWKEYLLLIIWIVFTIINYRFYKREVKRLDKNP
jgi:hypothetical protein